MTANDQTDASTDETPFETAVETMRDAATSRRGFLAGTTAAGLGALTFGAGGAAAGESGGTAEDVPGTDVDVLNYALTLEHLEDAFYHHNLESLGGYYSPETIHDAEVLQGFGDHVRTSVYENLTDAGKQEATHVETLEKVIETLGGDPVEKAEYDFGTRNGDDPTAFFETAMALENTGVMAYAGALSLIESPDLQEAAATVATVEARHASYLNLLNGADPFPAAFDEAKKMSEILDVASQFVVD
jgi:rubrerythrin